MADSLNNLEAMILRILEAHQGKDFSISRIDLVEKINACFSPLPGPLPRGVEVLYSTGEREIKEAEHYHERGIRRTIKHLREQHGERIGSTGRGYFMAETADEVKAISVYHRKRALSELYSAAKIERSSLPELLGQLSLDIGIHLLPPLTKEGEGGF